MILRQISKQVFFLPKIPYSVREAWPAASFWRILLLGMYFVVLQIVIKTIYICFRLGKRKKNWIRSIRRNRGWRMKKMKDYKWYRLVFLTPGYKFGGENQLDPGCTITYFLNIFLGKTQQVILRFNFFCTLNCESFQNQMSSIKLFVAIVPLIGKRETEREIKEWNSRGTPQWWPGCGSNRSQVTSRVKDREEISEKPVIKGKFVGMYPYCLMVFINKKCISFILNWKKWYMNEKSNYYIYKY